MEHAAAMEQLWTFPDGNDIEELLRAAPPSLAAEIRFSIGPLHAISRQAWSLEKPSLIPGFFQHHTPAILVHWTRFVSAFVRLLGFDNVLELGALVSGLEFPSWSPRLQVVMPRVGDIDRTFSRFLLAHPSAISEITLADAERLAAGPVGMMAALTSNLSKQDGVEPRPDMRSALEGFAVDVLNTFNRDRLAVLERLCVGDDAPWHRRRRIPSGQPTVAVEDMEIEAADAFMAEDAGE